MTVTLDGSWQSCTKTWINETLEQGHSPESIIEAMTDSGYDKDSATTAVHALLRGEMPRTSSYRYDPSPVLPGRVVHAHDRKIYALLRVNEPQLVLFDDVLSTDDCDRIIEMSGSRLQPSSTIDPATGQFEQAAARTSESFMFRPGESTFIDDIDRRICALMNCPTDYGEGLQVVHYRTGGQYLSHYDFFSPDDPGSIVHLTGGGQRVATLIVYLNNVEEGGGTHFPTAGISFSPRKGQALYFRYFNELGQLDPATIHAGLPVGSGEKWIINKWVRRYQVPR